MTAYRSEIIAAAAVAVILMQAAVIAALIVQRRRRRTVEDFNHVVLESMAAETAVVDVNGRILTTNDLWNRAQPAAGNCGLAGEPGDEYVSVRGADGRPLRNEHLIRSALECVLRGEQPETIVEYGWLDDLESRRWSQVRIRRLARASGGALIVHIDLTLRRRAETELQRQLHDHAHLTTMATVGETAGAMAHELNQPLAAMLSNAQALRHVLASERPDVEEVEAIIQDIIDADKRAADVITRVRRLIRKETFEMTPVDVNIIAHDVGHIITHTPSSTEVRLIESLTADDSIVSGDRVQLQQVLMNLLQNAVHAVRSSGTAGWVSITTSTRPATVEVVVSDNGPGIPIEELSRIFDPFFTTKREGMGLGLSISRAIVDLHGGTLQASNRPEGGASFLITLPKAMQTVES